MFTFALSLSDHLVNLYGPTVLMDPEMTKAAEELMQQGALMSPIEPHQVQIDFEIEHVIHF